MQSILLLLSALCLTLALVACDPPSSDPCESECNAECVVDECLVEDATADAEGSGDADVDADAADGSSDTDATDADADVEVDGDAPDTSDVSADAAENAG